MKVLRLNPLPMSPMTALAQPTPDKPHRHNPPWDKPLKASVSFTVPGIDLVPIPDAQNVGTEYIAGATKAAPHAGTHLVNFLTSPAGQVIYRKNGFIPPA